MHLCRMEGHVADFFIEHLSMSWYYQIKEIHLNYHGYENQEGIWNKDSHSVLSNPCIFVGTNMFGTQCLILGT